MPSLLCPHYGSVLVFTAHLVQSVALRNRLDDRARGESRSLKGLSIWQGSFVPSANALCTAVGSSSVMVPCAERSFGLCSA